MADQMHGGDAGRESEPHEGGGDARLGYEKPGHEKAVHEKAVHEGRGREGAAPSRSRHERSGDEGAGHGRNGPDVTAHNDARLVTMANQIAIFFASQPTVQPGQAVAVHLNDFWPPRMRQRLLDLIAAGGAGLRPEACAAGPMIRPPGGRQVDVAGVDPGTPPTREDVEGTPDDPAFAAAVEGSDG